MKRLYEISGSEKLIRLNSPSMEEGAPCPFLRCGEHEASLSYFLKIETASEFTGLAVSVNHPEHTKPVAVMQFSFVRTAIMRSIFCDGLAKHEAYRLGLTPFDLFELKGSRWIEDIAGKDAELSPFEVKQKAKLSHYIVPFRDRLFEIVGVFHRTRMGLGSVESNPDDWVTGLEF